MFHAIRQWWVGGRGKLTARLFAFEFVVVVAGVLVAQALANWAHERSERAVMERAKDRMEEQLALGVTNVNAWQVALPCLNDKLDEILRKAGTSELYDPVVLERPGFRMFEVSPMTDEVELAMIEAYGSERTALLAGLATRAERISALSTRASESWMGLIVLDPKYGQVRDADRTNARAIASEIKSALRSLEIGANGYLDETLQLGIAAKPIEGRRMPRNCADIARSGTMMPYTDSRPSLAQRRVGSGPTGPRQGLR